MHVGTSWVCRSSGFLEGHNPTAGMGSWVPSSLWRQFRGAQGTRVSADIALVWRQSWKLEKTCLQGWAVLCPNSGGERRGPRGSEHSEYGEATLVPPVSFPLLKLLKLHECSAWQEDPVPPTALQ